MITVLPIEDNAALEQLFNKEDIFFNSESCGVIANDGNEQIGYCLFSLSNNGAEILRLEPRDNLLLADGILRSALHVAICRGTIKAYYSENAPEELFCKLGFVTDKEKRMLDVTKLFKKCSSCSTEST